VSSGSDVDTLLAEARAAWSSARTSVDAFRGHLQERLDVAALTVDALGELRLGDLYIAYACSLGDERAIDAFQKRFRPAIRHAVSRAAPDNMTDEIVQQVIAKLFVAEPDKAAAICSYAGQGKLSTWLQVVARREARSRLRWEARHGRADPTEDEALERLMERATDDDSALAGLKHSYRAHFREAFRRAMESLTARERNLLRYECLDGLTRDEIGRIYGVSRPTVARWRAACRARLYDETERVFREELALEESEFASVLRMIESQLHVSLTRLLGEPESGNTKE
jgi:RNA polymerase sigma-70 factor (ECF subfamily)